MLSSQMSPKRVKAPWCKGLSGECKVLVWSFPPNSSKSWSPLAHPWTEGWQSTEPTKHRNIKRWQDQIVTAIWGGGGGGITENQIKNSQIKAQILCSVSTSHNLQERAHTKKPPNPEKLNLLSFSHSFHRAARLCRALGILSFLYHPRVKHAGSHSSTLKGWGKFGLKTLEKN